jgi:acetyl esterase/lipase
MKKFTLATIIVTCLLSLPSHAQSGEAATWATLLQNHYLVYPDQNYGTANNVQLKLDVWQNKDAKTPLPTVLYIHGGGWIFGDRTGAVPELLPYLQKGWNVVNVEYRMASQSLAPAAVEDSRCALRWVYRNADKFHFDPDRIIVTGHSAGGHLALTTGMLTADAGFDNNCPAEPFFGEKPLKVAAIINWYGITDVVDLLDDKNRRTYAIEWLGSQPNRLALAKQLSPLTYAVVGAPPVITIHGDADPTVPYSQALALKDALTKAHVANELITIPGGKHGFQAFTDAQTLDAYAKIFAFLSANIAGLK